MPAKVKLWGQQFHRKMQYINPKKPQIEITAASVTPWTKFLQVTGKEKKERGEGSSKNSSRFFPKAEKLSEGHLQTCSHISSPVDVGNTCHIHNAIVHHHQDKKMNGIPWRQQNEYLDYFYVTWKCWKFRAREYFSMQITSRWCHIRVPVNLDYNTTCL